MPLEHCELHQSCWSTATAASPHPGSLEMLENYSSAPNQLSWGIQCLKPELQWPDRDIPLNCRYRATLCFTEEENLQEQFLGEQGNDQVIKPYSSTFD